MNVGYSRSRDGGELDKQNCPICGSNISVNKYFTDFTCTSASCILYHGANGLLLNINKIKDMMK